MVRSPVFLKHKRSMVLYGVNLILMVLTIAVHAEESKGFNVLPGTATAPLGIKVPTPAQTTAAKWQALVCHRDICELRVVRLKIEPVENETEMSHVSLMRTRNSKPGEFTVAIFAGLPVASNPVSTYFTTRTPRTPRDAISGTIGVVFTLPDTGICRILPRWNKKSADDFMTLYVEQGSQRQAVGKIPISVLNRRFKTRDILIWAGDLDGDGKLDLITRNTPDSYSTQGSNSDTVISNGLNVWLSSIAKEGELMGLAASLDYWQDLVEEESGC